MTVSLDVLVANASGLHARPAAAFVRTAAGFRSTVMIANLTTGSAEVSARSLIGVLGLGVRHGHRVRLRIDGEDEAATASVLRDLLEDAPADAGPDAGPDAARGEGRQ